MMTDLRKAAEAALEALLEIGDEYGFTSERTVPGRKKAIDALRAALEQEKKWDLIAEMHRAVPEDKQ